MCGQPPPRIQPAPPATRSILLRSVSPTTALRTSTPPQWRPVDDTKVASLRGLWEAVSRNATSPPPGALPVQDRPGVDPNSSKCHNSQDGIANFKAALTESVSAAMNERLSRLMTAMEEKMIKDRAEIVNTLVTMCSSVEQRAANKIKVVEQISLEVGKLRSELVEGGLLFTSTPESTGDVVRPGQSIAAKIDAACAEVIRLRSELVDRGILLDSAAQVDLLGQDTPAAMAPADTSLPPFFEKQSPLVCAVSAEVLKSVRADDCIRHMEEQHQVLKQTLNELLVRLDSSGPGNAISQSALRDTVNETVSPLRDTVNEIVKVLGQELRSQRQQRNQDYSAIAVRLESLENTVLKMEKDAYQKDVYVGSHLSEPIPPEASQGGTADADVEDLSPAARLLQLEERMMQMGLSDPAE